MLFQTLLGVTLIASDQAEDGEAARDEKQIADRFGEFDGVLTCGLGPGRIAEECHRRAGAPERFGFEKARAFGSGAVGCTECGLFLFGIVSERFGGFSFLKVQAWIFAGVGAASFGLFAKELDGF